MTLFGMMMDVKEEHSEGLLSSPHHIYKNMLLVR